MDKATEKQPNRGHRWNLSSQAGLALILFGVLVLADQYIHTGWLTISVPFIAGLLMLLRGIFNRQYRFLIAGGIMSGVGAGGFAASFPWSEATVAIRLGIFLLLNAVGWLLILIFSVRINSRPAYWSLVPAIVSAGLGVFTLFTPLNPLELGLYLLTGIGLTLLVCGLMGSKLGLIIPGCLLLTIGPGIYYPWGQTGSVNGLTQTGTMLVIFALGWGLITVFSRMSIQRFIWWPLIPGGVLAMVGWGLYIGGNPGNALSFIGNTGSIGLIIFGIYLLLWRNEFRK